MSYPARSTRNADLAKIHLAKKQLGMSQEEYTAMLQSQAGVSSSADLNQTGRLKVLTYLARQGFKAKASATTGRPKRPTPAADKLPLIRRIRAQLISLSRKPDEYADGIAQQMFGKHIQFFEWCDHDQLHSISTALNYEQRRTGAVTE